jgi:aryl carrier-like protein
LTPTPTAKDDEEDDEALEDREKLLRRGLDKFETVST